jgi:hypothetical protein
VTASSLEGDRDISSCVEWAEEGPIRPLFAHGEAREQKLEALGYRYFQVGEGYISTRGSMPLLTAKPS